MGLTVEGREDLLGLTCAAALAVLEDGSDVEAEDEVEESGLTGFLVLETVFAVGDRHLGLAMGADADAVDGPAREDMVVAGDAFLGTVVVVVDDDSSLKPVIVLGNFGRTVEDVVGTRAIDEATPEAFVLNPLVVAAFLARPTDASGAASFFSLIFAFSTGRGSPSSLSVSSATGNFSFSFSLPLTNRVLTVLACGSGSDTFSTR